MVKVRTQLSLVDFPRLWINSIHEREIEFVLPITTVVLETATFDLSDNQNYILRHWGRGYQQGNNYGFENTKAKVLNRDSYTCQHCKK